MPNAGRYRLNCQRKDRKSPVVLNSSVRLTEYELRSVLMYFVERTYNLCSTLQTVANTRASGSRLAFSRHRHHSGRNRSASSCSHTQRNYSRESSENESPTRTSALVLFPVKEDLEYGYNEKPQNTRKRIPVLQHSQSLMVIPCHRTGKLVETADKSHRKRHSIHRPHSLPPVPHIKLLLEGKIPESQNVSHTSPTTVYISQQC